MITGDRVADRRHAYGEQRRGTQALHSPESDQQAVGEGQTTDQRSPAENGQSHHHHPPVTTQVAKPTARNHGGTYGDHVGTEHPLHVRRALVEVNRHPR
jgi:hypothetical protein